MASLPLLDARYEVGDLLSLGGRCRVYRARDRVSGNSVAIKRYDAGAIEQSEVVLRQKFWRLAQLDHPNLVKVLDYGRASDGTPLLVMEFVEGTDLRDLRRGRRPDVSEALVILEGIANGLACLHGRGQVHGDLKPANCLLGVSGVKLVDWGGDEGTVAYMSPARSHGAPPGALDDLYALGVIGAELLADVPLGEVDGAFRLLQHVRDGVPEWLTSLLDDLLHQRIPYIAGVLERLGREGAADGVSKLRFRAEASLVGRQALLAELGTGFHADSGGGGAWMLVGEAGVGKSRLAREALLLDDRKAKCQGFCRPEGQAALQPWRELLHQLAGKVPPHSEVIRDWLDAGEFKEKLELFEALVEWIRGATGSRLLIEDLQWADQTSLELFAFLAFNLAARGQPCQLLATSRPAPAIEHLEGLDFIRSMTLQPLGMWESAKLLAAHLGADLPAGPFVQWAHDLTGGNPLHLGELAASLSQEGHIRWESGAWRFPEAPPGESAALKALVANLAATLPADARELLFWGTILGKRFSLDTLVRVAGWPEARLFPAIDTLLERRLWIQDGDRLDFRHDRLREALEGAWDDARTESGHRAAARVLEEQGADPALLAHHAEGGRDQQAAFRWHRQAGNALAAIGTVGQAVAHWKRALEILDDLEGVPPFAELPARDVSQDRFDLWERIAGRILACDSLLGTKVLPLLCGRLLAEADTGRWREAAEALEALPPPGVETAVESFDVSILGGRTVPALALLLTKIVDLSGCLAMCRATSGDLEGAWQSLHDAEALLPDPEHWLNGLLHAASCTPLVVEWRTAETIENCRLARQALAPRLAAMPALGLPLMFATFYPFLCTAHGGTPSRDFDDAFLRLARESGSPDFATMYWNHRIAAAGHAGSWADTQAAEAEFERSLRRTGPAITLLRDALCARLSANFQQGAWERVLELGAALPSYIGKAFVHIWHQSTVGIALLALGRVAEAAAIIEGLERADIPRACWWGLPLARAWLAVARDEAGLDGYLAEALAADGPGPHFHPVRHHCGLRLRAEVAARREGPAAAEEFLEASRALAREHGNRLQEAITLLWRGKLLRDPQGRKEAFAEAESLFAELGNPHYPELIRRERAERWWILAEGKTPALPDVTGIEPTLRTVVERSMDTAKADRGKILLVDAGGETETCFSLSRPGVPDVEAYSRSVARHVIDTGQGLWLADVRQDRRFQQGESVLALDLRTVICVPLRWDGALRGLLYLDRRETSEAFTQEDFHLVETLAGYGALALSHAQIAEREQRQRRLAEALLDFVKAIRAGESGPLLKELAVAARAALGCRDVRFEERRPHGGQQAGELCCQLGERTAGPRAMCFEWGDAQGAAPEQQALALGIAELSALALDRAEASAREAEARFQAALARELAREREALVGQLLQDLRGSVRAIGLIDSALRDDVPRADGMVSQTGGSGAGSDGQTEAVSAWLQRKLEQMTGGHSARGSGEAVSVPRGETFSSGPS